MLDLLIYQFARGFYFLIILIPMGLVLSASENFITFPEWTHPPAVIFGLLYLIYASCWATRAAKLHTFENKSFMPALREARVQVNVDICVRLCFLPIIGPFFTRLTKTEKPTTNAPSQPLDSNNQNKESR